MINRSTAHAGQLQVRQGATRAGRWNLTQTRRDGRSDCARSGLQASRRVRSGRDLLLTTTVAGDGPKCVAPPRASLAWKSRTRRVQVVSRAVTSFRPSRRVRSERDLLLTTIIPANGARCATSPPLNSPLIPLPSIPRPLLSTTPSSSSPSFSSNCSATYRIYACLHHFFLLPASLFTHQSCIQSILRP